MTNWEWGFIAGFLSCFVLALWRIYTKGIEADWKEAAEEVSNEQTS